MLPYSQSIRQGAPERSLLRVLGGVLASLSILMALLGIIFYQHVPDLILAIIVGIFAARVLLLWLGNKPQHQQPLPEWSSRGRYATQASPYTQAQPTQYALPYSQLATNEHMQQSSPVPPTPDAPPPPKLPRSVRPQRPAEAPTFPAQPTSAPVVAYPPPSQPPSLWSPPLSAPASGPSRQEIWQYDDGKN